MNLTPFDYEHIRTATVAFLKLFTYIKVNRRDSNNNVIQTIHVPITYATKSKMYMSLKQEDKENTRQISVLLPRMATVITGINIIREHKLNELHEIIIHNSEEGNDYTSQTWTPTPIRLNFMLSIWTKFHHDAFHILEQIIPYFHTSQNVRIKLFDPFNIEYTTSIKMEGDPEPDITDEMTKEPSSEREIIWNLNFSMDTYLFKEIKDSKVIKKATVNFNGYDENDEPDPYSPYVQIIDEVDPFDSEIGDDWRIKETITEGGKSVEKYVERID